MSPGCLNCYAAGMARRLEGMGVAGYERRLVDEQGREHCGAVPEPVRARCRTLRIAEVRGRRAVFTGDVRTLEDRLTEPLRWRKPRRVFVNSMSDLFHEAVPFEFIDRVWAVMALCPQHTFQVLTKRPERMAEYLNGRDAGGRTRDLVVIANTVNLPRPRDWEKHVCTWPLPNVWLGASVEDQARADERIPHLTRCPAAVRFLSCEPLLGPVYLKLNHEVLTDMMDSSGRRDSSRVGRYPFPGLAPEYRTRRRHALGWVIVGGESGAKSGVRPCSVDWIRGIVHQCKEAGVPVFVKQLGAKAFEGVVDGPFLLLNDRKGGDPAEWPEDLRVREWPAEVKA